LGNPVNLNVIQTTETSLQNKYPPIQQYVSRRNEVALLNKQVELFCVYGGTYVIPTIITILILIIKTYLINVFFLTSNLQSITPNCLV